ncbi:hypothetical protein N7504_002226 [Penicillium tannophilum]|nr:hypothetical protein N7504_002226 [Penicillium tannophilum]
MPSLWYCCECSFGPHNAAIHAACISCTRRRCSSCREEKVQDSLHIHSSSHSCHETSPYPTAVNFNAAHIPSLDTRSMLPAGIDLPQIRSLRPGLAAPPTYSALGGMQATTYSQTYMYICCQCKDGPKVYNHQPRCIECQHVACSSCVSVK